MLEKFGRRIIINNTVSASIADRRGTSIINAKYHTIFATVEVPGSASFPHDIAATPLMTGRYAFIPGSIVLSSSTKYCM